MGEADVGWVVEDGAVFAALQQNNVPPVHQRRGHSASPNKNRRVREPGRDRRDGAEHATSRKLGRAMATQELAWDVERARHEVAKWTRDDTTRR